MANSPDTRRESRFRYHEQYLYWLAKVLLAGIVLYIFWLFITRLAGVLVPIFVALFIAYLLHPVVEKMVSWKIPRFAAIALLAAGAIGTFVGLLFLVVPTIADEMGDVLERLPEWIESRIDWIVHQADTRFGISADQVDEALHAVLEEAQRWGMLLLQGVSESASNIVNIVLIPVFTLYFLADFKALVQRPLILIPERYHTSIRGRARRMDHVVGSWIRGQLKVASILAVIFAVALSILGVKLGVVVGIVAGFLNVIPFVGSFTGGALGVLMVLMEGPTLLRVLSVVGLFVVVQAFETYWLTPRIVGSAVGFGPLTIITAILVGGALFGLLGVLIAVPVTAAGTILAKDLLEWYHTSDFWRGNGSWDRTFRRAPSGTGPDTGSEGEESCAEAVPAQSTSPPAAEDTNGNAQKTLDLDDAESTSGVEEGKVCADVQPERVSERILDKKDEDGGTGGDDEGGDDESDEGENGGGGEGRS